MRVWVILKNSPQNLALEWRNWQTHGTQNPAPFTGHVGSTPTSSTNSCLTGPKAPRQVRRSVHQMRSLLMIGSYAVLVVGLVVLVVWQYRKSRVHNIDEL